ncbi:CRISPR-associated endonuclease Cas1 [Pyrodictium delaneyi]|uniref:CRISPR-associated endonuclease Cas1 n=1 Tax=Pyrodictium delaneyi TaxID=1273541 RepID=A0A211YNS3_9CREN|nr:CRISPR-associated endonuclease Cas1 [Pyrodictium delaneyi]OWJ54507.1 CRISPR-associated endonuclease Cas1 [Pyrodictium delaneyi]
MTRVLVVAAHGARIRVHRRSLVVESNGERMVAPLHEVDRVVVATSGVSVTSSAIRLLARSGVGIVFLDAHGEPIVSLEPPWINAAAETRLAQYRASVERPLNLARAMVAAKLENQAGFLRSLARRTSAAWLREEAAAVEERMLRVYSAGSAEEIRGLEAQAARRYWGSLARLLPQSLGFQGRDHGSRDPVNTVLNYLYGVLYAEVFQALVVHGLDPYVGFLHALRPGSPALVYDYAEMFRVSAVDSLVYTMLASRDAPGIRVDPETGLLARETGQS